MGTTFEEITAPGSEQVLDEEQAHHVVEVVEHDGVATVPTGSDRPSNVGGGHRGAEGLDIDPWGHHLGDLDIAQLREVAGDLVGGAGCDRFKLAVAPLAPATSSGWRGGVGRHRGAQPPSPARTVAGINEASS